MIARAIATAVLLAEASCAGPSSSDQAEAAPATEPPRAAGGGPARAAELGGLKLATWNLEWLHRQNGAGPVPRGEADYARLRRYAQQLGADVIAFQEVDGAEAAARVFEPSEYDLHVVAQTDAQRTGFAFRRGLAVTIHPDYVALDVGQLRAGADISVTYREQRVRLLSVHLKSGCFQEPLTSTKKDCQKLVAQLPALEAWVDARAREGVAAVVLGDFNRRLFSSSRDPFWSELDDGEPPGAQLWSPTEGQSSRCWGGEYPEFIDHLVFNQLAARLVASDSFEQLLYDASDASYRDGLSDHCPLAVTLGTTQARRERPVPAKVPGAGARDRSHQTARNAPGARRIKGNVGSARRRIYHAPGCPDYARTQIDETKGERWFATPAEAEAAGWTKARNCP